MQSVMTLEALPYIPSGLPAKPWQPKQEAHDGVLRRLKNMKEKRQKSRAEQAEQPKWSLFEKIQGKISSRQNAIKAQKRWFMPQEHYLEQHKNTWPVSDSAPETSFSESDDSEDWLIDETEFRPFGSCAEGSSLLEVLSADHNPSWSEFEMVLNKLDFGSNTMAA